MRFHRDWAIKLTGHETVPHPAWETAPPKQMPHLTSEAPPSRSPGFSRKLLTGFIPRSLCPAAAKTGAPAAKAGTPTKSIRALNCLPGRFSRPEAERRLVAKAVNSHVPFSHGIARRQPGNGLCDPIGLKAQQHLRLGQSPRSPVSQSRTPSAEGTPEGNAYFTRRNALERKDLRNACSVRLRWEYGPRALP